MEIKVLANPLFVDTKENASILKVHLEQLSPFFNIHFLQVSFEYRF